jgi:hypothetical protein
MFRTNIMWVENMRMFSIRAVGTICAITCCRGIINGKKAKETLRRFFFLLERNDHFFLRPLHEIFFYGCATDINHRYTQQVAFMTC